MVVGKRGVGEKLVQTVGIIVHCKILPYVLLLFLCEDLVEKGFMFQRTQPELRTRRERKMRTENLRSGELIMKHTLVE